MHSFDIPTRNTLASLESLPLAMPQLVLNYSLGTGGPEDLIVRRLVALLVSSADVSLKAYRRSSIALDRVIAPGEKSPSHVTDVCEELEICLVFARRALGALERLGKSKKVPNLDAAMRRRLLAMSKDTVDLRDTLVHMDERITKGESVAGTPVIAMLTSDCSYIVAGAFQLATADLASLLTDLNSIASVLALAPP